MMCRKACKQHTFIYIKSEEYNTSNAVYTTSKMCVEQCVLEYTHADTRGYGTNLWYLTSVHYFPVSHATTYRLDQCPPLHRDACRAHTVVLVSALATR